MTDQIDTKLFYNEDRKYYAPRIGADGDFEQTEGFDTSILLSLFTDGRADKSQVSAPEMRRGWWGNTVNEDGVTFISKMWLLDMARLDNRTLNLAKNTAQLSLAWLVSKGYSKSVEVNTSVDNFNVSLNIRIANQNNALLFDGVYPIWQKTGTN